MFFIYIFKRVQSTELTTWGVNKAAESVDTCVFVILGVFWYLIDFSKPIFQNQKFINKITATSCTEISNQTNMNKTLNENLVKAAESSRRLDVIVGGFWVVRPSYTSSLSTFR